MNSDTPLTEDAAFVPDMTATEKVVRVEFARDLERQLSEQTARVISLLSHLPPDTLAGDVQRWRDEELNKQHKLAIATALLTRARNGPGVSMPHDLYDDIQHFLNAPP